MEFVLVRNLDLFMNFKVCLLRKTENDRVRVRVSKARFAMEFAVNRRIFLLCVE